MNRWLVCWILTGTLCAHAQTTEFRAFWVDAFHSGFKTSSQVTQLISDMRLANCNAIVVQVRKRGDAYYESHFEPKATDISSSFDPLDDLITKAHNTNDGPRIEVHAWVIAYPIWNNKTNLPPQPNHPYRLHPDWLTKQANGTTFNGNNYNFDPGHPEVQKHTLNVCMDILTNYDVDGIHFDHIRYEDNTWGYNDVTVQRFRTRFSTNSVPASTDERWLQFRRDQVTALVRKLYLNTLAIKPHVKVSCAVNTRAPGITQTNQWPTTASYSDTLQDWRAWLEEGMLDMVCPMTYYDMDEQWTSAWTNWTRFQKDYSYNRHVVIGPGIYMNTIQNGLWQIRDTRSASPKGNHVAGVCAYSYASTSKDGVSPGEFYYALSNPSPYKTNESPVFEQWVSTPDMPWKSSPTLGHLKGFVYNGSSSAILDGAVISVSGPANRTVTNDATGFYGVVDLAPGNYSVSASFPNYPPIATNISIVAGNVTTCDLHLYSSTAPFIVDQPKDAIVPPGGTASFSVGAGGAQPLSYQWRKDGNPMSGATNAFLNITNAQAANVGTYSMIVSNSFGTVLSSNALLMVVDNSVRFVSPAYSNNGAFSALLAGQLGGEWTIEASTNLSSWQTVQVTGSETPYAFSDPNASSFSKRFYRAHASNAQVLTDFETNSVGSTVMFQSPSFSSSTTAFIDLTAPTYASVTSSFPSGHSGTRVLKAAWSFTSGSGLWLRLTTASAPVIPNPTVGFNQTLSFDVYADRPVYIVIGLRETSTTASIGKDGGTSGKIEWAGGTTDNTVRPPKGRLVPAGAWMNLQFRIPNEPLYPSTGNGILESTTGKGVFEQITVVPADSSPQGPYNFYLDNFVVSTPSF